MKGIVFTELLDMVESNFGADTVDDIIEQSDLKSGGAYTSIGTYAHTELLQLVENLSIKTSLPQKELLRLYGKHLFSRFYALMPMFFEKPKNSFEFLESVHDYIHVEVKKIYPDASLPNFKAQRLSAQKLEMVYSSMCPFADFAYGLIAGCCSHFKENVKIEEEDIKSDNSYARLFTLTKN